MEKGQQHTHNQQNAQKQEERSVEIREEQLRATKEAVEAGEVRIGKEVITEQKTINVPVQREQLVIEQMNVSPRYSDQPIMEQGETIKIPLREEQVRVDKQTVVTGEVRFGKQVVEENQQASDSVKREEVRLDREGNVELQGDLQQRDTNQPQNQP